MTTSGGAFIKIKKKLEIWTSYEGKCVEKNLAIIKHTKITADNIAVNIHSLL
jgi:hypothetical protein